MTPALRALAWEHLFELGARHRIKIHRAKAWKDSEAHAGTRQVWVPKRMTRPAKYLVAMHEMGHVCRPGGVKRTDGAYYRDFADEFADEALAWGWALDNAHPELLAAMTESDWRVVGTVLVSYAQYRSKQRTSSAGYA